jgi:hypothetical protein
VVVELASRQFSFGFVQSKDGVSSGQSMIFLRTDEHKAVGRSRYITYVDPCEPPQDRRKEGRLDFGACVQGGGTLLLPQEGIGNLL